MLTTADVLSFSDHVPPGKYLHTCARFFTWLNSDCAFPLARFSAVGRSSVNQHGNKRAVNDFDLGHNPRFAVHILSSWFPRLWDLAPADRAVTDDVYGRKARK